MVRRLHASFSGSPEVGNGLDGELVQLVPQAGLTIAQTDAVIPPGTPVSSRSRSLKAELRRRTTFHSCIPTSGQVSHTVWHTFAILRIKSRQTPLFEPGSATFYRIGYRFCARPILPITYRSIRRPGGRRPVFVYSIPSFSVNLFQDKSQTSVSVTGGGPGVFPRLPLGAARSAGVDKRLCRRF